MRRVGGEHGQRQADVVVERAGRADRGPGGGQHLAEQVLGRGLARRAGDAERSQPAGGQPAVHAPRRQPAERGHAGRRRRRRAARRPAGRPARRGAGRGRGGEEVVAVDPLAGQRRRTGRRGRRVRESTVTAPVTRRVRRVAAATVPPTGRGRPRRSVSAITRGALRARRGPRAARSRSSNGCTAPATSWPVSWPLPATSSVSPGRARATAAAMAARRSPTSQHLGAPAAGTSGTPASMAARIAAGSSERGLSSVTTSTSLPARRGGAHRRPLARVAVAAAAEHGDQPAPGRAAQGGQGGARRRPGCARSRRRRRTAGRRRTGSMRPGTTVPASPGSAVSDRRRRRRPAGRRRARRWRR